MYAKIAVLCAFIAVASAGYLGGAAHGGSSVSSRRQDDFGNYAFKYQIADGVGATNGRSEAGDAWGNVRGSYNLADIDGRARRVEYVADGAGFRAVVKTNEPGTAHSIPAASYTASTNPGHVSASPAVIAHAPVAVAAAPVAAAYGAGLGYRGFAGAPVAAAYGAGLGYRGFAGAPVAAAYGAGLGYRGFAGAPVAAAYGGVYGAGLGYKGVVGAPFAAGLGYAGVAGPYGIGHGFGYKG